MITPGAGDAATTCGLPGGIPGALLGLFTVLVGVAAWRMADEEWVTGLRGPLNP